MKVLLHTCCANCSIYPLRELRKKKWDVFGFFYNPNIHPYQEYQRRLKTLEEFAAQSKLRMIYQDVYGLEEFLRQIVFRESTRCRYCYYMRMEATAQRARKGKFDYFTTTLLYSKQQKHGLIKEIGRALAEKYGVEFYYEDFRVGWQEGIEISKDMGLYRQQYCGCIYSEKARFCHK
jgi:predicted adenine nucleotide alpha hydrolase (AANH) superfamily ATPase